MQQEKIEQLEKQTGEHKDRLNSLETHFDNFKPLASKMDGMVESMNNLVIEIAKNTMSNTETANLLDRVMKKQDKQELDTQSNTNEIAAARPAIKTMEDLSRKMMYFGFFLVTLSVSIAAYVLKTGA